VNWLFEARKGYGIEILARLQHGQEGRPPVCNACSLSNAGRPDRPYKVFKDPYVKINIVLA
jgi:hypothetical protein